ncbi:MAG: glycosyltransferase family 39 protein [Desulfocapsaceae bacterium]|nr:glycosyltransferase family 39 protein [Desulfocapsaceae bacterium]
MNASSPQGNDCHLSTKSYFVCGLIILFVGLIAAIILLASVPPVDRDSLTHHLYIPRLYLNHGGIFEIPEIDFSYFPMNLEMLYMLPLAFGNDIIPKYIHFLFALLTSAFLYYYIKVILNRTAALIGVLFFLSLPVIVKLSITAYVDLGLIFFSSASLLLIFTWLKDTARVRYLLLAGACCGMAVGTKYNGLIDLLLLTMFVPVLYQRCSPQDKQSNVNAFRYGTVFFMAALLTFSPWAIRNSIWTGNPLYPLFGSIFGTEDTSVLGGMNFFLVRKFLYHESWWQTLLIPLRIFFEGQDDNPKYFDGQLNPFLLILPLFAFTVHARNNQEHIAKQTLAIFSFLYIILAFFQRDLRIRYIGPAIVPLVILSIYGFNNVLILAKKIQKTNVRRFVFTILVLVAGAALLYNVFYISSLFSKVQPLTYLSGKTSKTDYISHFRPEYPVYQYANQHLSNNSKTLCVFSGNRGYYLNIPHSFDFHNNQSILCNTIKRASTPADILIYLQQNGFTHLIIRNDLWQQWLANNLSTEKRVLFERVRSNNFHHMFSYDQYSLYEIHSSPQPSQINPGKETP